MDCSRDGRFSSYIAANWSFPFKVSPADASVWSNSRCGGQKRNEDDGSGALEDDLGRFMAFEENDQRWVLDGDSAKLSDSAWGSQFMSTSPQSTLAGMTNWELPIPSPGSNGDISSGVSSPPTPAAPALREREEESNALNLLYKELLRLKMQDEINERKQVLQLLHLKQQHDYQELLKTRQRQISHSRSNVQQEMTRPSVRSSAGWSLIHSACHTGSNSSKGQTLPRNLKRERKYYGAQGRADQTSRPRQSGYNACSNRRPSQAPGGRNGSICSAVPMLSNRESGMRAVFLEAPGSRDCNGTGVFLPRFVGGGHNSKSTIRKPACSTVLLPSRIVEALNLNVEDTLPCSPTAPSAFPAYILGSSSPARVRHTGGVDDDTASPFRDKSSLSSMAHETLTDVCLPAEWTY